MNQKNKTGKITEKQFLRMIALSVCSILLSLTCLVGTTWAWFSVSVTSNGNAIAVGSFASITVEKVTGASQAEVVAANKHGTWDLYVGTYNVNIKNSGNASCYAKLLIGSNNYETEHIDSGEDKALNLTVTVSGESGTTSPLTMQITTAWGKQGNSTLLKNDSTLTFSIDGSEVTSTNQLVTSVNPNTTTEPTSEPTTEPTTTEHPEPSETTTGTTESTTEPPEPSETTTGTTESTTEPPEPSETTTGTTESTTEPPEPSETTSESADPVEEPAD